MTAASPALTRDALFALMRAVAGIDGQPGQARSIQSCECFSSDPGAVAVTVRGEPSLARLRRDTRRLDEASIVNSRQAVLHAQ